MQLYASLVDHIVCLSTTSPRTTSCTDEDRKNNPSGDFNLTQWCGKVDLMGQGTWRVNDDRSSWAVWSSPVLSEEVEFVTLAAVKREEDMSERFQLVFQPFTAELWQALAVILFIRSLLEWYLTRWADRAKEAQWKNKHTSWKLGRELKKAETVQPERRWRSQKDEPKHSVTKAFYEECLSGLGHHNGRTPTKPGDRMITGSWIFLVFILTRFYGSSLTAFLTLAPSIDHAIPGLTGLSGSGNCIDVGCRFCVENGSANAEYFNETYADKGLNIISRPSVQDQIDGLLLADDLDSGGPPCDATELTLEDLILWGKDQKPEKRCKVSIVGPSIIKRLRGMMTSHENKCIVTGMNAIYHKFSTVAYGNETSHNAQSLHEHYFPKHLLSTNCPTDDTTTTRDDLRISLTQMTGPLLLFAGFFLMGTLQHFRADRKHRRFHRCTGPLHLAFGCKEKDEPTDCQLCPPWHLFRSGKHRPDPMHELHPSLWVPTDLQDEQEAGGLDQALEHYLKNQAKQAKQLTEHIAKRYGNNPNDSHVSSLVSDQSSLVSDQPSSQISSV